LLVANPAQGGGGGGGTPCWTTAALETEAVNLDAPSVTAVPLVGCQWEMRGRRRLHGPAAAATMDATRAPAGSALAERQLALVPKTGVMRRTNQVTKLAPTGTGNLDADPDRKDFPPGPEGDAAFEAAMNEFTKKHLEDSGVEARTADHRELRVGQFTIDFCGATGHGTFAEWVASREGWHLVIRRDEHGVPLVPKPHIVLDWILKMLNGKWPKGGTSEYADIAVYMVSRRGLHSISARFT
jgi:hypothetical protein